MKIFNVTHNYGSIRMVVGKEDVIMTARILENSSEVVNYHIEGMNIPDQQKEFGCAKFAKWQSPIQQ